MRLRPCPACGIEYFLEVAARCSNCKKIANRQPRVYHFRDDIEREAYIAKLILQAREVDRMLRELKEESNE